ncbi:hypothetical protein [Agromyces sp. SYSU T00266]|uniref:hypothetical protein n=1 Tax=Agromyces zhanjiangensis TaxID=3158562 RepID=UPI0033939E0C
MENRSRRGWWVAVAIVALTVSVLSFAQSIGYAIASAAAGGPVRWMWIDHAGPAVTSSLIAVATLAIGIAAAFVSRRRIDGTPSFETPSQGMHAMNDTVASRFAYAAAVFFVLGMIVIIGLGVRNEFEGSPPPSVIIYVFAGLAFHFALLPVISALPAPTWARASGYVWVVVDNMILMLTLYSVGTEIIDPLRWGIHLAAATWLLGASWAQHGVSRWIGLLAAFGLAGSSLGGAFTESALVLLRVAGPLMVVWLILAGIRLGKTAAPIPAPVPEERTRV